jgi:hypothetical protein
LEEDQHITALGNINKVSLGALSIARIVSLYHQIRIVPLYHQIHRNELDTVAALTEDDILFAIKF